MAAAECALTRTDPRGKAGRSAAWQWSPTDEQYIYCSSVGKEKKGMEQSSLLRGGDDLRTLVTRRAERVVAMRVAQLLADGVI